MEKSLNENPFSKVSTQAYYLDCTVLLQCWMSRVLLIDWYVKVKCPRICVRCLDMFTIFYMTVILRYVLFFILFFALMCIIVVLLVFKVVLLIGWNSCNYGILY